MFLIRWSYYCICTSFWMPLNQYRLSEVIIIPLKHITHSLHHWVVCARERRRFNVDWNCVSMGFCRFIQSVGTFSSSSLWFFSWTKLSEFDFLSPILSINVWLNVSHLNVRRSYNWRRRQAVVAKLKYNSNRIRIAIFLRQLFQTSLASGVRKLKNIVPLLWMLDGGRIDHWNHMQKCILFNRINRKWIFAFAI